MPVDGEPEPVSLGAGARAGAGERGPVSLGAPPGSWGREELAAAAREELGELPGRLEADLATLRSWLAKSPHLRTVRQDDVALTMFLRGCKFSLERTKEKLDFHYTVRGALPSWFSDWDPRQEQLAKIIRCGAHLPLPGYDRQGRKVIVMRSGRVDAADRIEDSFKVSTMVMELALEGDVQAQVCGLVLVLDMAGMTAGHALQMNPVVSRKATTVWEEAYPARPKALHFVNMPPVMESVFRMVQSFQKEKMRKRNHVHPKGDMTAVVADLGREVLPPEYGGSGPGLAALASHWENSLLHHREWLEQQTQYKTDETVRPGQPMRHSDVFGIEGSFRKLDID